MTDDGLGKVTGFNDDSQSIKKKSPFKGKLDEKALEKIKQKKFEADEEPGFFMKNWRNIWVGFLFLVFFIMLIIYFTGDFDGNVFKEILTWIAWIIAPPLVAIIIKKILML